MTRLLIAVWSVGVTSACGSAQAVTALAFKAKVGSQPFACGETYSLGTTATAYAPRDFRLYVHDVALIDHDGASTPFVLTDDGAFQGQGVALLDFENGQGGCTVGTPETHTTLTGSATVGHVHQVAFTLGVPFALNHRDAAAAPAPLGSTAMFWSWMGGYKFIKIEGTTTGLPAGHNTHIGSTACQAGATPNSVSSCDHPNLARVTIDFDADTQSIALDLAALLGGSNLDSNQAMSAPGCMSSPTDADCEPIFERLGLPFEGAGAGTQTFVSAE